MKTGLLGSPQQRQKFCHFHHPRENTKPPIAFTFYTHLAMTYRIRVWDLPTRLFHWALVVCVVALAITGQMGGGAMDWHFRFGYAVLALLLFRLLWGMVGGHWSRFSSFLYSPLTVLRYLRGQGDATLSTGHNPLGAGSVFAMLFLLLAQVATGLISDDEIAASGPLTNLVSGDWVSLATSYHRAIGKPALLVLVLLHVAAILFYRWRRQQNLLRPMLLGDKWVEQAQPSSRDDARSRLLAVVLLAACATLVGLMLKLAPAGM